MEAENEYIFEAIFHTLKLISICNKAIATHQRTDAELTAVISSYEKRRLQHLAQLAELLTEFQIDLSLQPMQPTLQQAA